MRLFRFGDRDSATIGHFWGTGTVIEDYAPPVGTLCLSHRIHPKQSVEIVPLSSPGRLDRLYLRALIYLLTRHAIDEINIHLDDWGVLDANYVVYYNLVMAYLHWHEESRQPIPVGKFQKMSDRQLFAFPREAVQPTGVLSPFPPGSTWQDFLAQPRFDFPPPPPTHPVLHHSLAIDRQSRSEGSAGAADLAPLN